MTCQYFDTDELLAVLDTLTGRIFAASCPPDIEDRFAHLADALEDMPELERIGSLLHDACAELLERGRYATQRERRFLAGMYARGVAGELELSKKQRGWITYLYQRAY